MTTASGVPRPSTRRWRLVPFFPPIRWIPSNGFLRKRCFGHCSIDALPIPGNPLQFVIIDQASLPECQEKPGLSPLQKVTVNGTGATELLLWQSLPVATGSQHIDNALKDPSGWQWLASAARAPLVLLVRVSCKTRNQRFYLLPQGIRHFPRLNSTQCTPPPVIGLRR